MKKIAYRITDNDSAHRVGSSIMAIEVNKPLIITIEPETKKRSNGQNSMQWVSLLGDFSIQGIINGRQFSAKVWHEFLKELHLPEEFTEGETMKNYIKWQEMPDGKLKMVGSTTQLTKLGFSNYMEKCYAYGSQELEIRFTANPNSY